MNPDIITIRVFVYPINPQLPNGRKTRQYIVAVEASDADGDREAQESAAREIAAAEVATDYRERYAHIDPQTDQIKLESEIEERQANIGPAGCWGNPRVRMLYEME